eukprot:gene57270-biopygen31739
MGEDVWKLKRVPLEEDALEDYGTADLSTILDHYAKDAHVELGPRCIRKHVCKEFRTPRDNSHTCDKCDKKQPKGTEMWGCRQCDYDMCMDCSCVSDGKDRIPRERHGPPMIGAQSCIREWPAFRLMMSRWRAIREQRDEDTGLPSFLAYFFGSDYPGEKMYPSLSSLLYIAAVLPAKSVTSTLDRDEPLNSDAIACAPLLTLRMSAIHNPGIGGMCDMRSCRRTGDV